MRRVLGVSESPCAGLGMAFIRSSSWCGDENCAQNPNPNCHRGDGNILY